MYRSKLIYLIACTIFELPLFVMLFLTVKSKKSVIKPHLIMLCLEGLALLPINILYTLTPFVTQALHLKVLFYIVNDCLDMTVMTFSIHYCDTPRKPKKIFITIAGLFMMTDVAACFWNVFSHKLFYIQRVSSFTGINSRQIFYWVTSYNKIFFSHFVLTGVASAITIITLFSSIFRKAIFYRRKYIGILISYALIMIFNVSGFTIGGNIDLFPFATVLMILYINCYAIYILPSNFIVSSIQKYYESEKDGIACFDSEGKCIFLNRMAKIFFKNQNQNQPLKNLAEKYLRKNFLLKSKNEKNNSLSAKDSIFIKQEEHHYLCEYNKVYDEEKMIGSFISFIDRSAEIIRLKEERYISCHDTLTSLLNRQSFFEYANYILKENPQKTYYLISTNIKDFKLVNQVFGQKKGDEILQNQSSILLALVGDSSIAGRMGDDKFCLLLSEKNFDLNKLNNSIEKSKALLDFNAFHLKPVMALRIFRADENDAETIYEQAMLALTSITISDPRSLAIYDDSLVKKILAEKEILADFDKALEEKEFTVFFQPVFDTDKKLIGAEALSRWLHPVKGILMPSTYIPVLEKAGLFYKLDRYIWEESLKKLSQWQKEGFTDLNISVNVSPKDSYYINIAEEFKNLLQKYDCDAKHLKIEFRETALTENFKKTMELSSALQELGCQIEIDDFGVGYSSLNMLKDVKADALKIDSDFLSDKAKTSRSTTILSFIIETAKVLNMRVITKCIENQEEADAFERLGCSLFQGFLFSKPLSIKDFEEKFVKNKF